jgi:FkbM family methyltransferase
MSMDTPGAAQRLNDLFHEPLDSVMARERNALEDLLRSRDNQVVLFGAGSIGRRACAALRRIGIEPRAFADNNANLWGERIENLTVLAPETAARYFGREAAFIVTIWNTSQWYADTRRQLTSLGCTMVSPPSPVYWRFPEIFLPFFVQDQPRKVFEQAADVLAAFELWADDRSREEYAQQVRCRAVGDWDFHRPYEESYFPDVFQLRPDETFVDCGAFDGDTIRALLARQGDRFERILAIEPDAGTFRTLEAYVKGLPASIGEKIALFQCAVGAERRTVHFASTGSLGSHISSEGGVAVSCFPLSELAGAAAVSYIKMDIEGAEYDALVGAREVIERDRPVLAICVYHTQNDLWRLPLLMRRMVPEYRMYLRLHEPDGWQTVAYAVPPERVAGAGHLP